MAKLAFSLAKIGGSMGAGMDEFRQRHERFELNRLGVYQFVFSYDLINKVCNFCRSCSSGHFAGGG